MTNPGVETTKATLSSWLPPKPQAGLQIQLASLLAYANANVVYSQSPVNFAPVNFDRGLTLWICKGGALSESASEFRPVAAAFEMADSFYE
jgi:hypothetical protein